MIVIRDERPADGPAREALLDACFGPGRRQKTCERLREGRRAADGLALVLDQDGAVAGTLRLWHVTAGRGRAALVLGPVAVRRDLQGRGLGAALVRTALDRARGLGHRAVLLVGDAAYYGRFGFSAAATRALRLPGPYAPERFLGLELVPGALAGARGLLRATGALTAAAPERRAA
jgi:predicted N-acetyltransferase YhbS